MGAYSVHLLVAAVHGHRIEVRADESAALHLGSVVDADGRLGLRAGLSLIDVLERFVGAARELAAGAVAIVGTDPLRRAADAGEVLEVVQARLGLPIEVLRHDEEALLSLLGVQAGRPIPHPTAILDVGGGSSEVMLVAPDTEPVAVGLPLGAARLSRSFVTADPPPAADLERLLAEARRVVRDAPDGTPEELVAVGGTASNLLRVGPALARPVLTVARIRDALGLVGEMPADVLAARFSVKPSRARVLPGGAAILLAVAERYELDRVRVSHAGLREGLVLATVHAGEAWRQHLGWLAQGWIR